MSINARGKVGGDLGAIRRAAGISQQRLAELSGCSLSMVRLLESGYRPTSGEVARRVAAALTQATATHGRDGAPGSGRKLP